MKPHRHIIWSMAFATLVCLVLLGLRSVMLGRVERVGIFMNIILAWIPYALSLAAAMLLSQAPVKKGLLGVVLVMWLLFLPNSAYLITDLTHWRKEKMLPIWFDWIYISAL